MRIDGTRASVRTVTVPPESAALSPATQKEDLAQKDKVELSKTGLALQKNQEKETPAVDNMEWLDVSKRKDGKLSIRFTGSAEIGEIVKLGYIMVEGRRVSLSREQKRDLTAIGKKLKSDEEAVNNEMAFRQMTASSRQQSDAIKAAGQKQNRVTMTAMRMMKGRYVSVEDEQELAEVAPDLYKLAKSVGEMERIKEAQEEEEKDRQISEENDRQREWENTPRDYSTPPRSAYPTYEARVNIDPGGAAPEITSMGEVTIPPETPMPGV